jgi:hypothetical protein
MPTQITLNGLSGASPFDVYTCDTGFTTCIYIATINSGDIPYVFDLPQIFNGMLFFEVKVVDDNDCVVTETFS